MNLTSRSSLDPPLAPTSPVETVPRQVPEALGLGPVCGDLCGVGGSRSPGVGTGVTKGVGLKRRG